MYHKFSRLFFALILTIELVVVNSPRLVLAAGPWYVAPIGNDSNDCSSPSTPCATINGAIDKLDFIQTEPFKLNNIRLQTGVEASSHAIFAYWEESPTCKNPSVSKNLCVQERWRPRRLGSLWYTRLPAEWAAYHPLETDWPARLPRKTSPAKWALSGQSLCQTIGAGFRHPNGCALLGR